MAHAENEIVINKPISDVFKFVADGLNNKKWRAGVVKISLTNGTSGKLGAEYAQTLQGPGGRKISGDYRITKLTPNQELSFLVTAGPARPTGNFLFVKSGQGTKVSFMLDFQPTGLAKLIGPMITKTMQNEVAQLSKLKTVLEKVR